MISNPLYIKHECEIKSLCNKLQDTLDKLPGCSENETMEETEIRYALQKAADALNDAVRKIEYFQLPVKEGCLEKLNNNKFQLNFYDGTLPHTFSCGSSIEIYIDDPEANIEPGWYAGRVEHNGQGYYFYEHGKPMLSSGMKARIRY